MFLYLYMQMIKSPRFIKQLTCLTMNNKYWCDPYKQLRQQ